MRVNHEVCNCSVQVVCTKCSLLARRASITNGGTTVWIPWLYGREDEQECVRLDLRESKSVCVMCGLGRGREGDRERERLCGRRQLC